MKVCNSRCLLAPIILLSMSSPGAGIELGAEVSEDQRIATILKIKVLYKQPGRYIGWPSIGQTPNGDLLVVFSGDRTAHVSPDGKTQMVRSRDGGKTWSQPVTIHDFPIDDRDAGITRTSKGTMLVSWFTGPPYGTELQGHYVIRSLDNGHTWGKPIRTPVTTPHGPVQLSDGRLLFIGQQPHCSHTTPPNYNGAPAGSPHTISMAESRDDGLSWKVSSRFPSTRKCSPLTNRTWWKSTAADWWFCFGTATRRISSANRRAPMADSLGRRLTRRRCKGILRMSFA